MEALMVEIISITASLMGIIRFFDWVQVKKNAKKEGNLANLNFTIGKIMECLKVIKIDVDKSSNKDIMKQHIDHLSRYHKQLLNILGELGFTPKPFRKPLLRGVSKKTMYRMLTDLINQLDSVASIVPP